MIAEMTYRYSSCCGHEVRINVDEGVVLTRECSREPRFTSRGGGVTAW